MPVQARIGITMRADLSLKQNWNPFRQENLPACALFLLLYAFGVSCGLASFGAAYQTGILPALGVLLESGGWRMELWRCVCYALSFTMAWCCMLLLSGMHALALPVWIFSVFLRSFCVGLCIGLCGGLEEALAAPQPLFIGLFVLSLLVTLPAELALGTLPLRRIAALCLQRKRGARNESEEDRYLSVGLRTAFALLFLTLLQSALVPLVLSQGVPGLAH